MLSFKKEKRKEKKRNIKKYIKIDTESIENDVFLPNFFKALK